MRIALVTTMRPSPWGGSEYLWAAACRAAIAAGHEVGVWCYRWEPRPVPVRELTSLGARFFFRRRWRVPTQASGFYRLIRPLATVFSFRPDVVLVSQGGSFDAVRQADARDFSLALAETGVPYVTLAQCGEARGLGTDLAVAKSFFERAATALFVAEENLEAARLRLLSPLPNGVVVRNPVNLRDTAPMAWPVGGTARLASVARLDTSTKGQEVLLACLAGEAWKGRDWTLDIYGEGPDGPYLRGLAAFLGLGQRVCFRGHADEMRRVWAEHHLLVMPSRLEGTPLSLVEAMLLGRPAVVTDVGGNREWVNDSESGFLAEAPTVRSFGAALERAWVARGSWESIGLLARGRAQQLCDPDPGITVLRVLESAGARPRGGAAAAPGERLG